MPDVQAWPLYLPARHGKRAVTPSTWHLSGTWKHGPPGCMHSHVGSCASEHCTPHLSSTHLPVHGSMGHQVCMRSHVGICTWGAARPISARGSLCGRARRHPYVRVVQVRNSGRVSAQVQAHALDAEATAVGVLAVEPAAFIVPPQGCVDVCLTLTGARLGTLQHVLRFLVRNVLPLRHLRQLCHCTCCVLARPHIVCILSDSSGAPSLFHGCYRN